MILGSLISLAPAEGQAGGIVVLWNDNIVQVTEIVLTNQEIYCMLQVCPYSTPFYFQPYTQATCYNRVKYYGKTLDTQLTLIKGLG